MRSLNTVTLMKRKHFRRLFNQNQRNNGLIIIANDIKYPTENVNRNLVIRFKILQLIKFMVRNI